MSPSTHLILAAVAVFGALIAWSYERERRRRIAIQGMAQGLGWAYLADAEPSVIPVFQDTELFIGGRGQGIHNFVSGTVEGRQVAAFDFSYVTGVGKSRTVWRQTVAYVQSPGVDAPGFTIRPESVVDKIGSLFGSSDIDVADDPDFSTMYLLRGRDEASVRALFGGELRAFFRDWTDVCAEGVGADLFFWRRGFVVEPHAIPALVEDAVQLSRLVASGAARPAAGA